MDELRAKFERKIGRFGTLGQDAPAHPRPRFDHEHAGAGTVQLARRGQARRARADDQNIQSRGNS